MQEQPFVRLLTVAAACGILACGDSGRNAVAPVQAGSVLGSTPGWFNGDVVTFDYTAPFQCYGAISMLESAVGRLGVSG